LSSPFYPKPRHPSPPLPPTRKTTRTMSPRCSSERRTARRAPGLPPATMPCRGKQHSPISKSSLDSPGLQQYLQPSSRAEGPPSLLPMKQEVCVRRLFPCGWRPRTVMIRCLTASCAQNLFENLGSGVQGGGGVGLCAVPRCLRLLLRPSVRWPRVWDRWQIPRRGRLKFRYFRGPSTVSGCLASSR